MAAPCHGPTGSGGPNRCHDHAGAFPASHSLEHTLTQHLGKSPLMVQRVWKETNLQPHRVKTFKVSNDPQFAKKLVDIVGL